jgi:hypothetical protein
VHILLEYIPVADTPAADTRAAHIPAQQNQAGSLEADIPVREIPAMADIPVREIPVLECRERPSLAAVRRGWSIQVR